MDTSRIEKAWKCTPHEPHDDGTLTPVYVWKNRDGTGNVKVAGSSNGLVDGVRFDHEPEGYLDEAYYSAVEIDPSEIPD